VRPPRKAAISPARTAAFEILGRVATTSEHSDDLLHGRRLVGLSQADRNLATALVLGVLRWQIALDARIRPLLQRPEMKLAQPIETALRLGAFQLLHMDRIPAHAALSESVELVRAAGQAHAAGMVNAVLRALTRQVPAGKALFETTAAVAERLGHPAWLVERWVANYGRAEAISVCEYDQKEPQIGSIFVFSDANFARLDDGSRLVAEVAAASVPGAKKIWDCCAAPGGKTVVLAARNPEAEVLATDVSPRRLKALAERVKREAPDARIRTAEADAAALPESEGLFDLILCDVPCSGTGTLVRNPEIRHHLRPSDLARQAERQRALLAGSLKRLAPGGRLVYSTCSLEPEENELVVEAVLAECAAVERVGLEPIVTGLQRSGIVDPAANLDGVLRNGSLRTLPGVGFQGDGFFAAMFMKS
jgi:16S rRNA (cytosine967-C5)-methyltransferase